MFTRTTEGKSKCVLVFAYCSQVILQFVQKDPEGNVTRIVPGLVHGNPPTMSAVLVCANYRYFVGHCAPRTRNAIGRQKREASRLPPFSSGCGARHRLVQNVRSRINLGNDVT